MNFGQKHWKNIQFSKEYIDFVRCFCPIYTNRTKQDNIKNYFFFIYTREERKEGRKEGRSSLGTVVFKIISKE